MPIYEYRCAECGKELEVIQKVSEDPMEICPSCHRAALRKKTSMSAFHLKGGGWYKDGYGKAENKTDDNKAGAAKGDNKVDKKGDKAGKKDKGAPGSKAESKPAASDTPKTSKAS